MNQLCDIASATFRKHKNNFKFLLLITAYTLQQMIIVSIYGISQIWSVVKDQIDQGRTLTY